MYVLIEHRIASNWQNILICYLPHLPESSVNETVAATTTVRQVRAGVRELVSCSTLRVPNCHANRRKHESLNNATLPKPRQGTSRSLHTVTNGAPTDLLPVHSQGMTSIRRRLLSAVVSTINSAACTSKSSNQGAQFVYQRITFTCSTPSAPSCHATRRKHEGRDTPKFPKPRQERLDKSGRDTPKFPKPRQERSRYRGRICTMDLPVRGINSAPVTLQFQEDSDLNMVSQRASNVIERLPVEQSAPFVLSGGSLKLTSELSYPVTFNSICDKLQRLEQILDTACNQASGDGSTLPRATHPDDFVVATVTAKRKASRSMRDTAFIQFLIRTAIALAL
ncbi:hypothetical protein T265_06627 [Opisthorchis viverrini]|uniref:Uncharacterized protein n=1 Tax=Opisthorchis viverrini TaxID=6198 RepID=A0A074ZFJ4_OPIVI|nr:hypothetical protein T265_06627 [Opisthorchis viverrini]KER26051.1 hypothetical protein T265_06627 [Opisthorchis viverrini]